MSKLLLILSALTFVLTSCGQRYKEYTFQEIGLHIKIPNNYLIQDTFPKPTFVDVSGTPVTDSVKIKDLEADLMKGLLIVSTPDYNNTFSFNIIMESSKTGGFEQYYNFSKDMQQLMAKQQMNGYDTVSNTLTVDSISFYKFLTHSTTTKPIQYSGSYLAKVRKYFLIIKADYIGKKFIEDMEKAILAIKFD